MNISSSTRKLTNLFILLFIALSGGLVYWQVVVAQDVTANPHSTYSRDCLRDNAPVRGRIYDRNGVLLADSKPSNNPLLCGYQRHYYEPSLAGLIGYYISPLFSSTGIEKEFNNYLSGKVGLTGLDNTMNKILHRPPVGDDIYLTIDVRIQRIVDHSFDADANVYPPDGKNRFATDRGSVIVTDPHTGEILAMLSRPGYDPNRIAAGDLNYFHQLETDPEQPLLERPINTRYVPGSSYKTLTLLAALDSGSAQLSSKFDEPHAMQAVVIGPPNGTTSSSCVDGPTTNCQGNALQYGQHSCIVLPPHTCGDGSEVFGPTGNNIQGYTFHFPVDLRYGFAHSDNIIFAQVGAKTGATTWQDYNQRFYVGKQIPFDLPVMPSSTNLQSGPRMTAQLAESSFGQGVDFVTPMQMSLFDNAIANDGTLMRPMLLTKIVDPNGTIVQSFSQQTLGTPISSQTASQMRDAMYGVVRCGSGLLVPMLTNSPWAIIGKTGTGEVPQTKPGQTIGAEAWLITQAPYQHPVVTIVAMKENGGEGAYTDGPMEADIYNAIFTSIMKIPQPPPPDPNYCASTGLLLP